MSRPKPGEEITYLADMERTGIVLDRGPSVMSSVWDPTMGNVSRPLDYRVWVHREDGTFDLVQVYTRGRNKGETVWHGWFTAGGRPLGRHNLPLSA